LHCRSRRLARICLARSDHGLIFRVLGSLLRAVPVFGFETLEDSHFRSSQALGCSQLIKGNVIAVPDFALDGTVDIAEGELRGAPAVRGKSMSEKVQSLGVISEPGLVEARPIAVGDVTEAHRETAIEPFGKYRLFPTRIDEVQQ